MFSTKICERTAHCRGDTSQQNCILIRHLSENNPLYTAQFSTVKPCNVLVPQQPNLFILRVLCLHLCLKSLIKLSFTLLEFQTNSSHKLFKKYLYISYVRLPCAIHPVFFTVLCSILALGFIRLVINIFFTKNYPKLLEHVLYGTETQINPIIYHSESRIRSIEISF